MELIFENSFINFNSTIQTTLKFFSYNFKLKLNIMNKVLNDISKDWDKKSTVSRFYNQNRNVINGVGIAAVAGLAIYAVSRWVPVKELVSKAGQKFGGSSNDFSSEAETMNRPQESYVGY